MTREAPTCVMEMAARVVATADPSEKVRLAHETAHAWSSGQLDAPRSGAASCAPDAPGRPPRPELKPPAQVPRRRLGNPAGRFALMHAVNMTIFAGPNVPARDKWPFALAQLAFVAGLEMRSPSLPTVT